MLNAAFVGCTIGDLLLGETAAVVGLERAPDGRLRVYLGARWRRLFVLLDPADPDERELADAIGRGWAAGGHCLAPLWIAAGPLLLLDRSGRETFAPHS